MKAALRIGLSIMEYNELTPHELNLHIQAYNEQLRHQSKEGMMVAYLTAAWSRAKKMPSWEKIFGQEIDKTQTPEQMLNAVKLLNTKLGGDIITKSSVDGK